MLVDTENKENPPEALPRPMEETVPAAALRAACDDVIAREKNYFGRKVGKDDPLAAIVENQKDYARRTLTPVFTDAFRLMGRDQGEEGPAIDRAVEEYAHGVSRRWANHRVSKPDLTVEAATLEFDVRRVIGGYL